MGKFRDRINTIFKRKKTHSDISGISLAGPYQQTNSNDTENSLSYQSYHKRVYDKTRHHLAEKPHAYLQNKSKTYNRWHSWEYRKINHRHVHGAVAAAWVLLVGFLITTNIPSISALSTWTQTDWSGGVGTSTANQYSAASNIDTSSSGQLQLAETSNSFSNPDFNTNLDDWGGSSITRNTDTKYSGAGSAQIAAGVVSTQTHYNKSTVDGQSTAYRLEYGDINGDGFDDLLQANHSAESFSTYLSNGDGTFASEQITTTTGRDTHQVLPADVENDGDIDLIVVYAIGYQGFTVYLNNGSGSFDSGTDYAISAPQNYCFGHVAHFDNDAYIDVVFQCRYRTYLNLATNDGDGTFTNTTTGTITSTSAYVYNEIAASDVNGDGLNDVAYAYGQNQTCLAFRYVLNNGAGFGSEQTVDPGDCVGSNEGANGVAGGDINNDGYDDIVSIRYRGNTFSPSSENTVATVFYGSDSGISSDKDDIVINGNSQLYRNKTGVADVNNDGALDIIASKAYSLQEIDVIINNGDDTFETPQTYSLYDDTNYTAYGFALGDMNGDDKIDIAANKNGITSGTIQTLLNRTGGDALVQPKNLGSSESYNLEGYVYTDGSEVTSSDGQLFANGQDLSTTFTATGTPGWYQVTAPVIAVDGWAGYGFQAKQGKTVYMDDIKLYKYEDSGTLTSAIYDLSFGGDWDTLTFTTDNVSNTTVKVRTSNDSGMSGAPAFAGCPAITSGTDLTGQTCVTDNERYVQYEVTLATDDGDTPVFEDISLQYDPFDNTPPTTNASSISMKRAAGGDTIASNGWSNGATPYFEWTAGADDGGGSGIKGYCLYIGQDNTGDPVSTKGNFGTSPLDTEGACQFAVSGTNIDTATANYIGTALTTSNSPYYLNVKAIDNANNVFASSVAQFQFRFDNTAPSNPSFVTAPSQFVASKEVTLTWPTSGGDAASDANSGLAGLQYRIGSTTWYGDSHSGDQDITDLLTNDGTYTTTNPPDYDNINEGNNIVYFRTWDTAGNVSSVYTTTVIKLNTSSPSSPQNVTATPTTNTTNSFAFSWAAPITYQGSASNITYCYTINTLPTENTCTFTDSGVTSLAASAYASQPGENTIYVVARDEANNINYATAASATFTANTSAPGIPLDLDIADVSTKATSTWRLALSWNAPTNVGAGVSSYRIYRSTDNVNFSQVASTSGTSYVDGGLSQQTYYYKLKACDSANNCGADSSIVNDLPTGRFTSPANLTAEPSVSSVSTKRALVKWSTDRNSDSTVSIGTSAGNYQPFQIASNTQTTDHQIELNNLTPGTTYYAKASWTDEDGNTGNSSEFVFKTEPAPSTQEVEIRRTTLSSAQIRFTSVSAAKVVVQYGLSDSFGGVKEISTSLEKSTYDVELVGLNDGAKYFFRLNTFDADGNEYVGSTVLTFTTPARPAISNLRFQPVENEPTSTQQVTWTTNVPTSSLVRYSATNVPGKEISVSELVTEHEVIIRGLLDDTEYSFIAESRDKDGNLAVSDTQVLRTALDTRPPKISEVTTETTIRGTGAEARGQIIVSWRTDEPATSQVAYAEGSSPTDFNNRTSEDTAFATEHIVIVSDLPTSTVYSVRPVSKDNASNESEGESQSAIIGRASDDVITIVLNTLKRVFGF